MNSLTIFTVGLIFGILAAAMLFDAFHNHNNGGPKGGTNGIN
jgi:hypothetical protein